MIAYDRSGSVIVLADGAELLVHDGPSEGPLWRRDCGSPLVALGAAAGAVIAVDRNGRARWFDARRDHIQATVEAGVNTRAAAVSPSGDVLLLADGEARVLTRDGRRPGDPVARRAPRRVGRRRPHARRRRRGQGRRARRPRRLPARASSSTRRSSPPPGTRRASGSSPAARASIRWDAEGMTHLTGGPDAQPITDVACSSDGQRIAFTILDNLVITLAWPSRDTAGSLEYPERKVDGLAFGPPTLLAVGLLGGDANKVDFEAHGVNRTDTHPGRPHRHWMVKVGLTPPGESAPHHHAPDDPAPRPTYAPASAPTPAKRNIATIVTVLVLLVLALYALVRWT
jgi:hypothetical protein